MTDVIDSEDAAIHRLLEMRRCLCLFNELKDLLERYPDALATRVMRDWTDWKGRPLLHWALKANCSYEVIRILIQHWPESVQEKGYQSKVALHYVRFDEEQSLRLVQLLVQAWPDAVHQPDFRGWIPLHHASHYGTDSSIAVIQFLIECWPESVQIRTNFSGESHLHLACRWGLSLAKVRLLLDVWPDAVRVPDDYNNLPVHCACANTSIEWDEVIPVLLKCWPESLQVCNIRGESPLHILCRNPSSSFCVISHVVDSYPKALLTQDDYLLLPLHYYVLNRNPAAVSLPILKHLVQAGPNAVRVPDRNGLLPLHRALGDCKSSTLDFIQLLTETWPESLQVRDKQGRLPLHWACRYQSSLSVICCILDGYPLAVQVKDNDLHLPLHYACGRKPKLYIEIMDRLVQAWPESCLVACPYTNKYLSTF